MKKLLLSAGLIGTVASFSVNAQSFIAGPYAGVEVGVSGIKDQAQSTANALVSAVGGSASVTQDTRLYDARIFAGYKVIQYVDLELGYTQTSTANMNYSGRSSGNVAYSGNANFSVSGIDYSAILRPSLASGFNNVFVRVGGTYLSQNQNNSLAASNGAYASSNLNKSGGGYILGLGYDLPIDKTFDVRAAYNYLGNIAGISNNYANRFSIGLVGKF